MLKSLIASSALTALVFISLNFQMTTEFFGLVPKQAETIPEIPLVPNTSKGMQIVGTQIETASRTLPTPPAVVEVPLTILTKKNSDPLVPKQLTIPAINLQAPIQGVGVNERGEMDVPSGQTNSVGWYRYGTVPGNVGSAVLDAHVYAAFSKLKYVSLGDSIYVQQENGTQLEFRVTDFKVYSIDGAPLDLIFNRNDGQYLTLITCAGSFIPSINTYSHRLVIFAKLKK